MSTNFVKNLNILNGIVVYNDFDIDEKISFQDQEYSFKEDILQIKFDNNTILDVGWYPEFDPEGHFIVYAIKDCDWENPLYEEKCRTQSELKDVIEKTAKLIASHRDCEDFGTWSTQNTTNYG